MELFIKSLLRFEQFGDLELEFFVLTAENLKLAIVVGRLEGDLF